MGNGAKGMKRVPPICVTVMAHNEEARIAKCLGSLPLGNPDVAIHVVVNGSSDKTAEIARGVADRTDNIVVHEYVEGGKARSWNRFILDELEQHHAFHVFADGDAEILPGSVGALVESLRQNPNANAASGFPRNGRRVAYYGQQIRYQNGMFGDLYVLRGEFLSRMKKSDIRLPEDLVGDDGLLCALAKTDLQSEANLEAKRVLSCEQAGFLCEPISIWSPASWALQYRRMINYSVRHFQNAMITTIMRGPGPKGLPTRLSSLYPAQLPNMAPRKQWPYYWFDRIALRRMKSIGR
jgi:glycosyltransferase involved in cell wall biosynthesis